MGLRNGALVKLHPICHKCFEKCSAGHVFGYGEHCNVCAEPRRRINLTRHKMSLDDPTFGLTDTGSTSYPTTNTGNTAAAVGGLATGYLYAQKFTQGSNPGTLQSISFRCYGAGNVGVALYSHNAVNDKPASPLTTKQIIATTGPPDHLETVTMTDANRMLLVASTIYWIVFEMSVSSAVEHSGSGGRRSYKGSWTYGTAFPDPWGTSSEDTGYQACVYWTHVEIKGYAKATKAVLSDTGACISVSFYSHAAGNVRLAIFDQSGSAPNARQWQSGSVACSAAAWATVNISAGSPTSLLLVVGTYWLAWQWDSETVGPSYTAGSSGDGHYIIQAYGAFPATWTGGTSTAEKWSQYVTYTALEYISVSDSGVGTEAVAVLDIDQISVSDAGEGVDSIVSLVETVTISETGAATEAVAIREDLPVVADSGAGTEAVAVSESVPISDQGAGVETTTIVDNVTIHETGLGIDIVYHIQGELSLDEVSLPHVINVTIQEPSIIEDLAVMEALPYRSQLGKEGRRLIIQGWTDSLSTLEILRGYGDGQKHLLLLPTGDSMSILVGDVRTPENVENYDRYDYAIDAIEVVD